MSTSEASTSEFKDATWTYSRNNLATSNPVAMLELRDDRAISRDFIGSVDLDYQVHGFEELRLHSTLNADWAKGRQWTTNSPYSSQSLYWGWDGWDQIIKRAYTMNFYAQYFKDFNENHHFDIMLVLSTRSSGVAKPTTVRVCIPTPTVRSTSRLPVPVPQC